MLDFAAPANLEWLDLSSNEISKIERVNYNPYLKYLNLNCNKIKKIENVVFNKSLTHLCLSNNCISQIENLDDMWLEELDLSENRISKITGLTKLKVLQKLNLSKNNIVRLNGLQTISSLRFLNLSLNSVEKILQLQFIESLTQLTELDFCFNPIQNKKHYRAQVLFHIPQLRQLDG